MLFRAYTTMDRTERFHIIDNMLANRRIVPFQDMQDRLEVSRATLRRDLEYLRNRLNAPIVWDRDQGGYRYERPDARGGQFELPGLWFNAQEIHALLTMQHLLANLDSGGLLAPHIAPLMSRLTALLGAADNPVKEVSKRVMIQRVAARKVRLENFETLGSALLRRKRVLLGFTSKQKNETLDREVSPQRLVHYRDNWYLDAWCHLRHGLRSFAVDGINRAEVLEKKAREVPRNTLDAVLGSGYGIFSGRKVQWARLRFSPERARWVSLEQWHPKQKGHFDQDGAWILEIPYNDDRELIMDILRHGGQVRVLAPASLRERVRHEAHALLQANAEA